MRTLVTGHLGYLGSALTPLLAANGHLISGIDLGWFEDCLIEPGVPVAHTIRADVRTARPELFEGMDAVVHLAGLSNDPLGELDPALTHDINVGGTAAVLRSAAAAGVSHMIFVSSCAVYGAGNGDHELDESAAAAPVTAYAASKAAAEKLVAVASEGSMRTTTLRVPTIYGPSPRLRLDLVVNEMAANGLVRGRVELRAPGTLWRPLLRIEDFCRAVLMVLGTQPTNFNHLCYNLGADNLNYRLGDIARIAACETTAELVVNLPAITNNRSYRVSFRRIAGDFPSFKPNIDLTQGLKDLLASYRAVHLNQADLESDRYRRLPRLIRVLQN